MYDDIILHFQGCFPCPLDTPSTCFYFPYNRPKEPRKDQTEQRFSPTVHPIPHGRAHKARLISRRHRAWQRTIRSSCWTPPPPAALPPIRSSEHDLLILFLCCYRTLAGHGAVHDQRSGTYSTGSSSRTSSPSVAV